MCHEVSDKRQTKLKGVSPVTAFIEGGASESSHLGMRPGRQQAGPFPEVRDEDGGRSGKGDEHSTRPEGLKVVSLERERSEGHCDGKFEVIPPHGKEI